MAKKIHCTVLKSDPFVERRKNRNREHNKYRRDEDVQEKTLNTAQTCTCDKIGWLGIDQTNFEIFCTGLSVDCYA